jgi:hypothetical protein
MVEHNPDTIEVAGSSPAMPTKKRTYSSVGLECLPYKWEVQVQILLGLQKKHLEFWKL